MLPKPPPRGARPARVFEPRGTRRQPKTQLHACTRRFLHRQRTTYEVADAQQPAAQRKRPQQAQVHLLAPRGRSVARAHASRDRAELTQKFSPGFLHALLFLHRLREK